jgi:predicted DNA-binding transcriptional regulator AlpA
MDEPDRLIYFLKDLTRLLGCSRTTVQNLRREGHLPPPDCEIGPRLAWTRETVEKWLRSGGTRGVARVVRPQGVTFLGRVQAARAQKRARTQARVTSPATDPS